MGIWTFLFGKPKKITDDFFGDMTIIVNDRKSETTSFECSKHFSPSGLRIGIGINTDLMGPYQSQKDFFHEVEDRYNEIIQTIIPYMEDEISNWKEGFRITDFKKEFVPVYLEIPTCTTRPLIWDITFESVHDPNHVFILYMQDFEAKGILRDG